LPPLSAEQATSANTTIERAAASGNEIIITQYRQQRISVELRAAQVATASLGKLSGNRQPNTPTSPQCRLEPFSV
jgi:hypothetical protein